MGVFVADADLITRMAGEEAVAAGSEGQAEVSEATTATGGAIQDSSVLAAQGATASSNLSLEQEQLAAQGCALPLEQDEPPKPAVDLRPLNYAWEQTDEEVKIYIAFDQAEGL